MISRCCLIALSLFSLLGCAATADPGPMSRGASDADKPARTQGPPPIDREFRGVWIATVANIDWPSELGLTTAQQQDELTAMLDEVAAMNLNAAVFQVRTTADALYDSPFEPWSAYLTGTQGQAPEPYYDPLAFAIEEAHRRGIELHAWINPLRASHPSYEGELDPSHVSFTKPAAVPRYGTMKWMDPGHPETLRHTLRVVEDLVSRYDLDGLHIDDYFYPYPQNEDGQKLEFPDAETYAAYQEAGGRLDRSDWRRENVNTMVRQMHRTIKNTKPHVKFGISPFGIWRPAEPAYVKGMDQYEAIYADARLWLKKGWCDYFTPQLYWTIENPDQSFLGLLQWWMDHNPRDRHLYPGLYASRTADGSSRQFDGDQIGFQVRWSRILLPQDQPGHVHFSMKAFLENRAGLRESLPKKVYPTAALPPVMPWLRSPDRGRRPALLRVDHARLVDGQYEITFTPRSVDTARWITVQSSTPAPAKTAAESASEEDEDAGPIWTTAIFPAGDGVIRFPPPDTGKHADADADAEGATPDELRDIVWVRAFDRLGHGTRPIRVELNHEVR